MRSVCTGFLIMMLWACEESKPPAPVTPINQMTEEQKDSVIKGLHFYYDEPLYLDSSDYVFIPISTAEGRKNKSNYYSSYEENLNTSWNILFYNLKSHKSHLLTDDKIHIVRHHSNTTEAGPIIKRSILYQLIEEDLNLDKKLDYKDPTELYISKDDGSSFRQISPQKEDLARISYVPGKDQLLIQTIRDTNNDTVFDQDDEKVWYHIEITDSSHAINEWLNEVKRDSIAHLFLDQWLGNNEQ